LHQHDIDHLATKFDKQRAVLMLTWRSTSAIPEPDNVTNDAAMANPCSPSPCFGSMAAGGADLRSRKAVYFAFGKRVLRTATEVLAASRFRTITWTSAIENRRVPWQTSQRMSTKSSSLYVASRFRMLGCSLTFARGCKCLQLGEK